MAYFTMHDSPVGPLLLLSDGAALTGLFTAPQAQEAAGATRADDAPPFPEARRELDAYFAGRLTEFTVPLSLRGTPFQVKVWEELRRIPYGVTLSYGELARRIGQPSASRAVGMANGRNPISIIVPCHRVIGSNGKLVGYGGGLPVKDYLLCLEGASTAQPALAFG